MENCREINCVSALHHLTKSRLPYTWDLNVYRGCAHHCQYCFAMYTHKFMQSGNYFGEIFVKTNVVEQLERQLCSPNWKREVVNLGGVTDNYQPAEADYRFMPEILKLLIKYKTPCIISSKSDLILRDYDLIDELSRITYVNIAQTITTVDADIAALIEPGAVNPDRRFQVLKEFRKTNASTGLHAMPILPLIADDAEALDALYGRAAEAGVRYAICDPLNLRGQTKPAFFAFLQQAFPALLDDYGRLYKAGSLDRVYKTQLYARIRDGMKRYGISSNFRHPMKEKLMQEPAEAVVQQLSLFPE